MSSVEDLQAFARVARKEEDAQAEVKRLRSIIKQIVEAYDSGNLQMSSPEVGEPENDIPMHPWHEEWLHYARKA
jgi:hypothetical protein